MLQNLRYVNYGRYIYILWDDPNISKTYDVYIEERLDAKSSYEVINSTSPLKVTFPGVIYITDILKKAKYGDINQPKRLTLYEENNISQIEGTISNLYCIPMYTQLESEECITEQGNIGFTIFSDSMEPSFGTDKYMMLTRDLWVAETFGDNYPQENQFMPCLKPDNDYRHSSHRTASIIDMEETETSQLKEDYNFRRNNNFLEYDTEYYFIFSYNVRFGSSYPYFLYQANTWKNGIESLDKNIAIKHRYVPNYSFTQNLSPQGYITTGEPIFGNQDKKKIYLENSNPEGITWYIQYDYGDGSTTAVRAGDTWTKPALSSDKPMYIYHKEEEKKATLSYYIFLNNGQINYTYNDTKFMIKVRTPKNPNLQKNLDNMQLVQLNSSSDIDYSFDKGDNPNNNMYIYQYNKANENYELCNNTTTTDDFLGLTGQGSFHPFTLSITDYTDDIYVLDAPILDEENNFNIKTIVTEDEILMSSIFHIKTKISDKIDDFSEKIDIPVGFVYSEKEDNNIPYVFINQVTLDKEPAIGDKRKYFFIITHDLINSIKFKVEAEIARNPATGFLEFVQNGVYSKRLSLSTLTKQELAPRQKYKIIIEARNTSFNQATKIIYQDYFDFYDSAMLKPYNFFNAPYLEYTPSKTMDKFYDYRNRTFTQNQTYVLYKKNDSKNNQYDRFKVLSQEVSEGCYFIVQAVKNNGVIHTHRVRVEEEFILDKKQYKQVRLYYAGKNITTPGRLEFIRYMSNNYDNHILSHFGFMVQKEQIQNQTIGYPWGTYHLNNSEMNGFIKYCGDAENNGTYSIQNYTNQAISKISVFPDPTLAIDEKQFIAIKINEMKEDNHAIRPYSSNANIIESEQGVVLRWALTQGKRKFIFNSSNESEYRNIEIEFEEPFNLYNIKNLSTPGADAIIFYNITPEGNKHNFYVANDVTSQTWSIDNLDFKTKKIGIKLKNGQVNGGLDNNLQINGLTEKEPSELSNVEVLSDNLQISLNRDINDIMRDTNNDIIYGFFIDPNQPINFYVSDFSNVDNPTEDIIYKVNLLESSKTILPIPAAKQDLNIVTLTQEKDGVVFNRDFNINSYSNILDIQNTKTKKIHFKQSQKHTYVNCVLEKEEQE